VTTVFAHPGNYVFVVNVGIRTQLLLVFQKCGTQQPPACSQCAGTGASTFAGSTSSSTLQYGFVASTNILRAAGSRSTGFNSLKHQRPSIKGPSAEARFNILDGVC
jgi:hypothetical protein